MRGWGKQKGEASCEHVPFQPNIVFCIGSMTRKKKIKIKDFTEEEEKKKIARKRDIAAKKYMTRKMLSSSRIPRMINYEKQKKGKEKKK